MTLSLAARCPATGQFGVVITSSSPAVAARCAHVRAGCGAVCTQNITDPRLGPRLLDLLLSGFPAQAAIDAVVATTPNIEYRQLIAVDVNGNCGAYSGERTLGLYATAFGDGAVAAGNLLSNQEVPAEMLAIFALKGKGVMELGDRLIAALQAGLAAGGEEGPVHSAGLLIADMVSWPVTDLRVDWSDDPAGDLAALWTLWQPQRDDYIIRALEPTMAPGYGVPGDPGT